MTDERAIAKLPLPKALVLSPCLDWGPAVTEKLRIKSADTKPANPVVVRRVSVLCVGPIRRRSIFISRPRCEYAVRNSGHRRGRSNSSALMALLSR
jgi:hypothetical protein